MLKKQTVWLLTMLSLMIVLSVYYMTCKNGEFAYIDKGEDDSGEVTNDRADTDDEEETEVDGTRNIGQDEIVTTMRMVIRDKRSLKKDRGDNNNEEETEVDGTRNLGQDELYTTMRMEIRDKRSLTKDRLESIVTSSTASVDEKNKALENMDQLDDITAKESILEESIMAAQDYDDVLVRSEDDKVHVHVKVDELSDDEVIHIMQMIRDEFGDVKVNVNYQPTEN